MSNKDWIRGVFRKKYPDAPEEWIDKAVALEIEFEDAADFVDEKAALKTHSARLRSILTAGE